MGVSPSDFFSLAGWQKVGQVQEREARRPPPPPHLSRPKRWRCRRHVFTRIGSVRLLKNASILGHLSKGFLGLSLEKTWNAIYQNKVLGETSWKKTTKIVHHKNKNIMAPKWFITHTQMRHNHLFTYSTFMYLRTFFSCLVALSYIIFLININIFLDHWKYRIRKTPNAADNK